MSVQEMIDLLSTMDRTATVMVGGLDGEDEGSGTATIEKIAFEYIVDTGEKFVIVTI